MLTRQRKNCLVLFPLNLYGHYGLKAMLSSNILHITFSASKTALQCFSHYPYLKYLVNKISKSDLTKLSFGNQIWINVWIVCRRFFETFWICQSQKTSFISIGHGTKLGELKRLSSIKEVQLRFSITHVIWSRLQWGMTMLQGLAGQWIPVVIVEAAGRTLPQVSA